MGFKKLSLKVVGTTYKTVWSILRCIRTVMGQRDEIYQQQTSVKRFAHVAFVHGSVIHNDGYRSYILALEGYAHEYKPYDLDSDLLHWLHIVISNVKAFILGTYRLPKKIFQPYHKKRRT